MYPFRKFLTVCICCILFQKTYGKNFHSYIPYNGSSKSVDETNLEKKLLNAYPESGINVVPQSTHLRINTDVSKYQQILNPRESINNPSNSDSTDKTLEMKVGEYLVKVQSKKLPSSSASKNDERDSFINPKYSHVIEIIHRRDNLEKQDTPVQIYDATKNKQAVKLKKTVLSEAFTDETEKFSEINEGMSEKSNEMDEDELSEANEEITDKFSETGENIFEESQIEEEFSETAKDVPEDSDETNEEEFRETDYVLEDSDETNEEEFSETDEDVLEGSDETNEEEFSETDEDVLEDSDETNEEEFSETDEDVLEDSDETNEEEFSETDEDVLEDSDETNEEEFSETDEDVLEDSDETNEKEFSETAGNGLEDSDEVNEEEFSETAEDVLEDSDETNEEKFSEADEDISDESDGDLIEEFGEADDIPHESDGEIDEEFSKAVDILDESDGVNEEEFSEADEDITEESDETNEDEFSEEDENIPLVSGGTYEEKLYEAGIDIPKKSDKNNKEEFSEAGEGIPGKFSETDKGDVETDERDSEEIHGGTPTRVEVKEVEVDTSENIKTSDLGANNAKKNGTNNEKVASSEESDFIEEFEGSGEELADIDRNATKTGRILGMFSRQNETFPNCTTPKGEAGHCRRLGECLLSEALNNFNGFLQQLCLIRGALVGICCPDNPVIETVNPDDENATSELKPEEIKQPPEGCGLNAKTRIVGGSISVPHEWTWMVALMRRNRFYCGGVIINNWYILTAAHCVMGMKVQDLTVRLGEYDFNEESKHTEDLTVSEIKRHAQFVTLTFQHDIALLKLKRSVKYSKFVGSICLPDQKARDYSDAKGTVVGWGTVSFGGAASPVLRQVTVPVWKNEDCDKTYLLESIGDSFMCAGSPEKGEDACQGDSGGPLMTVTENGRWEVIGLVSWGRRCGDPTYPGVYTRVTTYLDWIKQNAV